MESPNDPVLTRVSPSSSAFLKSERLVNDELRSLSSARERESYYYDSFENCTPKICITTVFSCAQISQSTSCMCTTYLHMTYDRCTNDCNGPEQKQSDFAQKQ